MIDRTVILDSLVLGFDSDLNNQNTLVNELTKSQDPHRFFPNDKQMYGNRVQKYTRGQEYQELTS